MSTHASAADPVDWLLAATRAVRRERRRIASEVRAFETFREAVRDLPTAAASSTSAGRLLVGPDPEQPDASAVRRAYESSVMGVSHYAADYADTYPESLEAEFGPDLADALLEGPFTEPCKRALLAAAGDALDRRTRFLDELEAERRSLEAAERTVRQVAAGLDSLESAASDRPVDALTADRSTVVGMKRRCRSLASDRQATIREQSFTPGRLTTVRHLQEYLYADLERTYPVLAAVTEVIVRIERLDDRDDRGSPTADSSRVSSARRPTSTDRS